MQAWRAVLVSVLLLSATGELRASDEDVVEGQVVQIFGSSSFLMRSDEDQRAVVVYFRQDVPSLSVGSRVRVAGHFDADWIRLAERELTASEIWTLMP